MSLENVEEQRENNVGGITGKGFVPGQSGNPGGRPKGSVSITRHIREALERQDEEEARLLADAIIKQAKEGNSAALKTVMDRIDGPVKEETEHSGGITIKVEFGDDPAAAVAPRPGED